MKTYRIFLAISIILFLSSLLFSQSLVKEGHQWNVRFQNFSSPDITTSVIQIGSDTIIGDTVYHAIWTTLDTFDTNWVLNRIAIREDAYGKVYTRLYDEDVETLEYDFSLQLNDTFLFSSLCREFEVYNIDSITLNNGERRKQIHLKIVGEDSNFGPRWVEGIGDIQGGLFGNIAYCITDVGGKLLCYYDNEELLYPETPLICFEENVVFVRNNIPSDIAIYPNPISEMLTIRHRQTLLRTISLVDITGRIIYKGPFVSSLDVSNLEIGTYILLLEDDAGNVYSDKLVKMD